MPHSFPPSATTMRRPALILASILAPIFAAGCDAADNPHGAAPIAPTLTFTLPTTITGIPLDKDGDGYEIDRDCDDTDPSIHPGAVEIVADGVDQDCNDRELCYLDADDDGARDAEAVVSSPDLSCTDPNEAVAADPIDCDEADPSVHPGATEVVADGVDSDCDGTERCYLDDDLDGYGEITVVTSPEWTCTADGVADNALDCNDSRDDVNPGAVEIVADGVDSDCDGTELCWVDDDLDGFGTSFGAVSTTDIGCVGAGLSLLGTDCDDSRDDVNPGAVEIVADGIDNDCDLLERCYADADGDGRGEEELVDSIDLDCDDPFEAPAADDVCPGYDDGLDADGDAVPDGCDVCPLDFPDDTDNDGVCDSGDLCPGYDDNLDTDGDGIPNGCDACTSPDDADIDGVPDDCDICPGADDGLDADGDAVPDGCDPCPADFPDDTDGDGVCDSDDLCPGYDDGFDDDGDGIPDDCDDTVGTLGTDTTDTTNTTNTTNATNTNPGPTGTGPTSTTPSDRDGDAIPDDIDADPDDAGGAGKGRAPRPPMGCSAAGSGVGVGVGMGSVVWVLAALTRRLRPRREGAASR